MNSLRRIAAALVLVTLIVGPGISAGAAGLKGQDDPFEKLKSYDFQSRAPVAAINQQIQQALGDKAALAQIEQSLVGVLEDPATTFAGKQEACRMLWIVGSARSVPTLAKMLTDDKLSDMARYALERNADPSAAKALRVALATAQGKVLVGIINSIGNRGDADAVAILKPFTASDDSLVSSAAIAALGKIGNEHALAVLISLPTKNLLIYKAMLHCAERLAATGKPHQAEPVYESLVGEGRPDVVRVEALRGLAGMLSPQASAMALTALRSPDTYVQEMAARVCGSFTDKPTTARCLATWPVLPTSTQVILLTALSDRREAAALSIALDATESKDPALRTAGIQAVGRVGGVKAVLRLVTILAHGEGGDRDVARASLINLPGDDVEQALLQAARQGLSEERAALMSVLVERPTPGAVAAMLAAAHDSNAHLAAEAVRALGRVGGQAEYDALVKLLVTTPSDDVRDAGREALVAISQRMSDRAHAVDTILAALPGASAAGQAALLPVLASIGGSRALDTLTQATTSDQPEVKQAAIAALADTWNDSRPLPTLLTIAQSGSSKALRVQALRGYLRLVGQDERMPAEEKVQRIGAALTVAERPEEKTQALSVLRDCRVPQAMELAEQLLDDPDLFEAAADTVLYLAAPQKKGDTDLPAVKGDATTAALDKVIQRTKDDNQRAQAQKLR
jgi:HEAT repeat protein